jgi:hypothetical protein
MKKLIFHNYNIRYRLKMTSSSIILSNILASESCELKNAIDSYMDTKLKELQEIMKMKVESVITGRLDKFYNKSFEDHEKVLFNKDGSQFIDEYNSRIYSNFMQGGSKSYIEIEKFKKEIFISKENTKCFSIERVVERHTYETIFYKTLILCRNIPPAAQYFTPQWDCRTAYKHNLSTDCLYAIKHFQACYTYDGAIKLLEEHPEYFKKNCSDFEALCHKEYVEIEKTKNQLKLLMDENMSKKNYYTSLDKKFKDFEQEKKQLDEERQKIKEEKEKMVFIKEKLVEMKLEVELEKQKILEQKSKTIDIDKCFEDIISSEMPKNKTGSKVAFD